MKAKALIAIGLVFGIFLANSWPQLLAPVPVEAQSFKVVGYSTSWSGTVGEIQFDKLTHVNYAFLLPNDSGDGGLKPLDNPGKLQELVSVAHTHGVKVLISVGGWNDGNDQGFERLAANASTRTNFVNNMVNFVNTYNLDGVDIDWEYPDPYGNSAQNYAALMQELCSTMHNRGKLCTAAVVALGYTGGGILNAVFDYVDYLTLMAYDGGDGAAHSPYSYAVDSLDYWLGRGLPKSKAILGVPFYGRPTWAAYQTLVANDPQAPYKDTTVYQGQTVYYNGIQTIKDKTNLALQRGGGVMIWELAQDTTDDTSLLRAIYEVLHGPLPTSTPTQTPTVTSTPTVTPTPNPNNQLLSQNKPAFSSSDEAPGWNAPMAVDGNTGTRWSSLYSDPQWLYVDLGAVANIDRVILNWEAAYGKEYQIQVSNDANNWTTVYHTTKGDGGIDDIIGLSATGRYVRMYGIARGTEWGYSHNE